MNENSQYPNVSKQALKRERDKKKKTGKRLLIPKKMLNPHSVHFLIVHLTGKNWFD